MKPDFQNVGDGSCAATASHYQTSDSTISGGLLGVAGAYTCPRVRSAGPPTAGRLIPSCGATIARLLEELESSLGLAPERGPYLAGTRDMQRPSGRLRCCQGDTKPCLCPPTKRCGCGISTQAPSCAASRDIQRPSGRLHCCRGDTRLCRHPSGRRADEPRGQPLPRKSDEATNSPAPHPWPCGSASRDSLRRRRAARCCAVRAFASIIEASTPTHCVAPQRKPSTTVLTARIWPQRILVAFMATEDQGAIEPTSQARITAPRVLG
jgi:hypothetical protein